MDEITRSNIAPESGMIGAQRVSVTQSRRAMLEAGMDALPDMRAIAKGQTLNGNDVSPNHQIAAFQALMSALPKVEEVYTVSIEGATVLRTVALVLARHLQPESVEAILQEIGLNLKGES